MSSKLLPRRARTRSGERRRIGIELELSGIELEALAAMVAEFVGGEVYQDGRYELRVSGDPAGDWGVEIDHEYLKQMGREERDPEHPLAPLEELGEDVLRRGLELVVPLEVVSPPLAMTRIGEFDRLVAQLREAGACGTSQGIAYAFGLHLNPELPDTRTRCVVDYLKAFLCLYPWLKRRCELDMLRRITSYIDPFPSDYVQQVIEPGYRPNRAQLIDDYLEANPTRNRALDMLPLFAHLDAKRVRAALSDPRIKPRPTFHYRLPNSEVDQPGWGVQAAWQDWLQVEELAADRKRLDAICVEYARFLDKPLERLFDDWAERIDAWLPGTAPRDR